MLECFGGTTGQSLACAMSEVLTYEVIVVPTHLLVCACVCVGLFLLAFGVAMIHAHYGLIGGKVGMMSRIMSTSAVYNKVRDVITRNCCSIVFYPNCWDDFFDTILESMS